MTHRLLTRPTPPRTRTRQMLAMGSALALALGAAACGSTASASAGRSPAPSVSIPASVPDGVTLRVADQLDFIKNLLADSGEDTDLPYTVQWSEFVGGPPMLEAFQAGAVDVGYVADTPVIFAQAAGQSIVAVAAWASSHGSDALVSAPGVHLTGWASLRGHKVAYQQGTVEEAVLLEGLESAGLTLHDVTSVNLPTTSLEPALESGSVTAAILVQPLTAAYLEKNPTASQVTVGNDITTRTTMLIASDASLSDSGKVAAIADFIERLEKAYAWVDTHRAAYARDLYVDEYKVSEAEGVALLSETGASSFFPLPGPLLGPQQALADLYYSAGEIPQKVNVSAEFDTTFNRLVGAAG